MLYIYVYRLLITHCNLFLYIGINYGYICNQNICKNREEIGREDGAKKG